MSELEKTRFEAGDVVQRTDRPDCVGRIVWLDYICGVWYAEVKWLKGGKREVTMQSVRCLKRPDGEDIITILAALDG